MTASDFETIGYLPGDVELVMKMHEIQTPTDEDLAEFYQRGDELQSSCATIGIQLSDHDAQVVFDIGREMRRQVRTFTAASMTRGEVLHATRELRLKALRIRECRRFLRGAPS